MFLIKEEIFKENEGLVYYCVSKVNPPPYEYNDCIQEGFMELWKACCNFDSTKGYKFSTYAVPCVMGAMKKYLRLRSNLIKIPNKLWDSAECEEEIQKLFNPASLDFELDEGEPVFYKYLSDDKDYIDEVIFKESLTPMFNEFIDCSKSNRTRPLFEQICRDFLDGDVRERAHYMKKFKLSHTTVGDVTKLFREMLKEYVDNL